MDFFSKNELKNLIEHSEKPCVSIYMPTVKLGSETQQNPIRFKNMMTDAEAKLEEMGIRVSDAKEWLKPVLDLDAQDFWEHQELGLAIFASPNMFRYFRVPLEFEELVVVSDRFHLKPLLPLMTKNGRFFILTLSQQGIQLLEATQYDVREIEVKNMPDNLDQALLYDETAKEGQFRIFTGRGGTNNPTPHPGATHGQGSERDKFQRDILQYFQRADGALHEILRDEQAPLILAGVEYLQGFFREASSYNNILEEGIAGNTKLLKPEELREEAWKIVEPYFEQSYEEDVTKYKELNGSANTNQAFDDLNEIVSAAYYQRLDSLFVAVNEHKWGRFDPESNQLEVHDEPKPEDQDLLDFAAVHTFLNGGKVYAEPREKVPGEVPAAAIARY